MSVSYTNNSGNSINLVPAPFVTLSRNAIRDNTQTIIRNEYNITLDGTIVNVGNELSSSGTGGTFGDIDGILSGQEYIKDGFSEDGILSIEGLSINCLVESVTFEPSTWTTRCDYTIRLKAYGVGDEETQSDILNYSEDWEFSEQNNGTTVISHSLTAVGLKIPTGSGYNDPVAAARNWCQDRSHTLSNGAISGSGTLDFSLLVSPLGSGGYWNMSRIEGAGVYENSWRLTENFLHAPSGNAREEYNITVNYAQNNPYRANLSINGTIFGYANRDLDFTTKFLNAKNYWNSSVMPNLYTRVSLYKPTGFTVATSPSEQQITYNETEGSVGYSYIYNASSGSMINNAIEESISISDTNPTDVFAQIQVPGRNNGPVVQYMETKTLPERTVSINATIASAEPITLSTLLGRYLSKPDTTSLINILKPGSGYYYIKQDVEEWNPINGQYSRSVGWVINPEGATVSGLPTPIDNNT